MNYTGQGKSRSPNMSQQEKEFTSFYKQILGTE